MSEKKYFLHSFFYSCVVSIGGFLFGYHTAAISGALIFITRDFNLTIFQQEFLVSLVLLGALIGSWLGGTIADIIGRKKTFFFSIIFLIFGTIFFVTSKNILIFFSSRTLVGFSIGIFSAVVPIYIAEISEPKYRGRLISINQLFLVTGILISNIFGYYFSKIQNWELIFLMGLIFAFLMLILLFFIPETPSYLVNNNQTKKAFYILRKVRKNISDTEVMQKTKTKEKIGWPHLLAKGVRSAFFVGIGINIFRQITGINVVTYYAPKIFHMAGFDTPHIAMLATLLVTSVNLIATIISLWLIDKIGRRPLLISGITGMILSLFILSSAFFVSRANPSIIVIALMGFTSSFAIGLGAISWVINSEIYPMEIRGRAVGISTFINWICNYLVSISFLSLLHNFGKGNTFLLYGSIGVIALFFVIKKVPETKGKSFLEIQKFFKK